MRKKLLKSYTRTSCLKLTRRSNANSISIINSYSYTVTYFRHMEESLELMQNEFESMEDYWQKKINEEKVFNEEQLNVCETQCKELEARMKEYKGILEKC